MKKTALVCGAGGFIGSHLIKRLKNEGYWVRGVDLKYPEFSSTVADEFQLLDLRVYKNCLRALKLPKDKPFDEVYQLAADMGGAGYIFTGEHDVDIMHNSAQINLNFIHLFMKYQKIFYSSSACIYPQTIQEKTDNKGLKESDAYPANPDSEYGWEKLFSERAYLSLYRNNGREVRIARFHNIFGPEGTWRGGKEKAPAAISRKVLQSSGDGVIEIWGDGKQTRSFLYIDECLEGVRRLMNSQFTGPVNIGSEEMISINDLAKMAATIAGKKIKLKHIPGPLGVRGRNSENSLIREKLKWAPTFPLVKGMEKTGQWIASQLTKSGEEIAITRRSPEEQVATGTEGIFHFINMERVWRFNNSESYRKVLTNYLPNVYFPEGATIASQLQLKQERAEDFVRRFLVSMKHKKHFFIGCTDSQVGKLSAMLKVPVENLRGFSLEKASSVEELVGSINEFTPAFVWNCHTSEMMSDLSAKIFDKINAHFIFNVGDAVLRVLGIKKKAPKFVRKMKAEWLYRLVTEFDESKTKVIKSYSARSLLEKSVTVKEIGVV